jgi:hypothetical protein
MERVGHRYPGCGESAPTNGSTLPEPAALVTPWYWTCGLNALTLQLQRAVGGRLDRLRFGRDFGPPASRSSVPFRSRLHSLGPDRQRVIPSWYGGQES